MNNRNNYSVLASMLIILAILISWPDILWFSAPSFLICVATGLVLLELGIFLFKKTFNGFLWAVASLCFFEIICFLKYKHVDEPLKIFDFIIILDVNNWNTDLLEWKVLFFISLSIAFFSFSLLFFLVRIIKSCLDKNGISIIRVVSAVVSFLLVINVASGFHKFNLFESFNQGSLPYFVYSAFQIHAKPEVYENSKEFKAHVEKKKDAVAVAGNKKPDIIVWLHEATVNPDIFCEYAGFQKLALFKENAYAKEMGWLRVHTYGGGTWLSEFALLSGLTSYDFGAKRQAVYYVVTPRLQDSFVKNLKASGYHTIALLPQKRKNFYNAENAYRDFGFDEIISIYDLNKGEANKWRNSDDMIKESIIKLWEKHAHRPTFIFTLSISQHAPFFSDYPEHKWNGKLNESKGVLNADLKARMQDYWSRLPSLSLAMTELEQRVLVQKTKNVILASFGDHHPDFDFGQPSQERAWQRPYCGTSKLKDPRYLTYYKIQDNFSEAPPIKNNSFPDDRAEDLSFLGGKLLARAGLKASPFFKANQLMYHLCQGRLDDCPNQSLVKSYKSYIYNDLRVFR